MIRIPINDIEAMAKCCAELTRQGIAYDCEAKGNIWLITCTGH